MTDHYRVLLVEDDLTTEDLRLVLIPANGAATVRRPRRSTAPGEPITPLPAALTAPLPTDQPWTTLIVENDPHRRKALTAYLHCVGRVTAVADHAAALALPNALHPDLIVLPLPNPPTADAELITLLTARYPRSRLAYTTVLGAEPVISSSSGSVIQQPETNVTPTTCSPARTRPHPRTPTRRAPSSA